MYECLAFLPLGVCAALLPVEAISKDEREKKTLNWQAYVASLKQINPPTGQAE